MITEQLKVKVGKDEITLDLDTWRWQGSNKRLVAMADCIAFMNPSRSPSQGQPGCAMAALVAQELGGEVSYPDYEESPPGTIH